MAKAGEAAAGNGDSDIFRSEAAAAAWLANVVGGERGACPRCGSRRIAVRGKAGTFRCGDCRRDFSVRTGTLFERSHLPLHLWLRALRLDADSGGGISSTELARELGIRQPSAWSMLRRLRSAGPEAGILYKALARAGGADGGKRIRAREETMAMTRQELAGLIYDGIRDGSLRSGGRLPPEREIAAIFNTSRNAVREALIVLETLGFIEVRGKEGIFVRSLSEEECNRSLEVYTAWPTEMLPHTFQVRILIEGAAAGLAARNRTKEDILRMARCLQELSRISRDRPPDWSTQGTHVNDLFHKLVIEAAHNPVLLRIHEGLVRIIKKAYSTFGGDIMVTPLEHWEDRIIKSHGIIMGAIEDGDEKRARDIMRSHLEITFDKLDAFYQERIKGVLKNHGA